MKIRHRYTTDVIYQDDAPTIKETVEAAVKAKVNLSYCDLSYCDLSNSDLSYCDLSYSNLRYCNLSNSDLSDCDLSCSNLSHYDQKLTLIGDRPVFSLGTIGSRNDYLWAYLTDQGVYVRAGCFFGTLDEFADVVEKTHGDNIHGREYRAAIELIKVHAELWMPETAESEK